MKINFRASQLFWFNSGFVICFLPLWLVAAFRVYAAPLPVSPPTGSFTAVGSMSAARSFQTATLLGNGKILIAGGLATGALASAELFDPATGSFTVASPMNSARYLHTATLLPSGKVLIAGGFAGNAAIDKAELFDPATGSFTALPAMNSPRHSHSATLLPSGKVLIAGGSPKMGSQNVPFNTAELFDPASGTFAPLLNVMTAQRDSHTATLLPNGKVLIAGGYSVGYLNTAELFDPGTSTFTPVSPMASRRYFQTATLLPGGKVLVAGGFNGDSTSNTAELFDPATGNFASLPPMTSARYAHSATLLPNGKVLISGGTTDVPLFAYSTAELFDPALGTFTPVTPMTSARYSHTATLLTSGKVLLTGGFSGMTSLKTAEVFDSATGNFASVPPMSSARYWYTSTQLPNGKILIAGGKVSSFVITNTAELFDPVSQTFAPVSPMTSARFMHTATLLANGKVLITGGYTTTTTVTNTAELFDPEGGTFMSIAPMTTARVEPTATLLPSGKVLIAGGLGPGSGNFLNTAELFDPETLTFALLPNTMNLARYEHTATLLANGKVLVAGGITTAVVVTNTAELFDPVSGTFASLSPSTMTSPRGRPTATLLPSGKVLIAGGYTGATNTPYSNTAELYDPVSRTFVALPSSMTFSRYLHTTTLLSSGRVLIAGGVSNQGAFSNTTELFEPDSQSFSVLPPMTTPRQGHSATLLPNGKVLISGGYNPTPGGGYTSSAEVFDLSLGFSEMRRPMLTTATDPLILPASLALTGSRFRGDSEASGIAHNNSATNYPVVQLMRVDNEQTFFVLSDPATNWTDTSFVSEPLGALSAIAAGEYRVTVFTNGIPSLQKIISIPPSTTPVPVALASVVSRKAHGNVSLFDVPLPLSGPRGIECRSGGQNGDHTLIFNFVNTLVSVGGASVTDGGGMVSDSVIGSDPHQYIVQLTGVSNAQVITVSLSDVNDSIGNSSASVSVPMGILLGDTTANGSVNSSDISQTKVQSGNAVTVSNFRTDINLSGSINSSDISLVKSKSGTALP